MESVIIKDDIFKPNLLCKVVEFSSASQFETDYRTVSFVNVTLIFIRSCLTIHLLFFFNLSFCELATVFQHLVNYSFNA